MARDLYADIQEVLVSEEQLNQRTQEIAAEIDARYGAIDGADEILLIGVLKGCYMFMADLSRAIKHPHRVDFMAVSSYGNSTKTSGAVQIILDLQKDISGKHVIIVEDIIDTGLTLQYLRKNLIARRPKSLEICSLLSKPARHKVEIPVDYLGFEVPDEFVVGYGLDFAQLYRNLPFVAILKPEVFS